MKPALAGGAKDSVWTPESKTNNVEGIASETQQAEQTLHLPLDCSWGLAADCRAMS